MIKLLFSEKQILIASLVLILLANTTNLTFPNAVDEKTIMDWGNTVEAAESDAKQICKDHDGEWKNDECKFEKDSKYPKEQNQEDFEHYMEDHDLWDDYAATQQDKKIENACDKAGLKMTKDGLCDTNNERGEDDADKFYREYDKVEKENPKIEDLKNTVVTDTEKEFEEQQKYFQARAESNSNSDNLPEVVEKIVSEQKEEEIAEADEQVEEESDDSESEEVEEEQEEEYEPEEEEQEEEEPEEDNSDSESKE